MKNIHNFDESGINRFSWLALYWQRGPCPQEWCGFGVSPLVSQQQEFPNFRGDVQDSRRLT